MRMTAFVLLAAWLPVTALCVAHCSIEPKADICCPQTGKSESVPSKANCVLSLALVKVDEDHQILFSCALDSVRTAIVLEVPALTEANIATPTGPERILVPWQFLTRAAPLPRAPSFVS
jgi:hypothetical protein